MKSSDRAERMIATARRYQREGRFLKALATLKRASEAAPRELRIYREFANLYLDQGLFKQAYEQLDVLVEYMFTNFGTWAPDDTHALKRDRNDHYLDEINARIAHGEDEVTEFKSTVRRNLREDRNDDAITFAVVKTIAAFLNTHGGALLIGVGDDGTVAGLHSDGFQSGDKFKLFLFEAIRTQLGVGAATYVSVDIATMDGRNQIAVVECRPAPRLVFARRGTTDTCYVRTGPSSVELPPSRVLDYAMATRRDGDAVKGSTRRRPRRKAPASLRVN